MVVVLNCSVHLGSFDREFISAKWPSRLIRAFGTCTAGVGVEAWVKQGSDRRIGSTIEFVLRPLC